MIIVYRLGSAYICFQITRRIERVAKKVLVDPHVAERKTWAKFGAEKGSKPGPDKATTTVAENVNLKLTAGNKVLLPFLATPYPY